MESLLYKLNKAGLAGDHVSFIMTPEGTEYSCRLSIDSLRDPSLGTKSVTVSLLFAMNKTPDIVVDELIEFIGTPSKKTTIGAPKVETNSVQEEPPIPSVKESVNAPTTTNVFDGFTLPTNGDSTSKVPPMNTAGTSSNIGIPVAPKTEVTDFPIPPPPPKKEGGIRDVQLLAIQAILKLRKVEYTELVTAAFQESGISTSEIPEIEKLTEEQALEVIRFGNNKYKK